MSRTKGSKNKPKNRAGKKIIKELDKIVIKELQKMNKKTIFGFTEIVLAFLVGVSSFCFRDLFYLFVPSLLVIIFFTLCKRKR